MNSFMISRVPPSSSPTTRLSVAHRNAAVRTPDMVIWSLKSNFHNKPNLTNASAQLTCKTNPPPHTNNYLLVETSCGRMFQFCSAVYHTKPSKTKTKTPPNLTKRTKPTKVSQPKQNLLCSLTYISCLLDILYTIHYVFVHLFLRKYFLRPDKIGIIRESIQKA